MKRYSEIFRYKALHTFSWLSQKRKKKGVQAIFEYMLAENFPNFMRQYAQILKLL